MTSPTADPVDRLLLDEAAEALGQADSAVIIDDVSGGLTQAAAERHPDLGVRVVCDSLLAEQAVRHAIADLADPGQVTIGEDPAQVLPGATVVLLRLPKSLGALDEIAAEVAALGEADVIIFAGERVKHMTRSMNDVLGRYFDDVTAGLGRQKSRVLRARGSRAASEADWPRSERHEDLDLTVCAHGSTFAGTGLDLGTRLLTGALDQLPPDPKRAVDLGCGSGILACLVARERPDATVQAIDESTAACRSAIATAAANGLAERITVSRSDGLTDVAQASIDVIVCNPPFHRGTTKDSSAAEQMIKDAGRALAPGGEMWMVFNAHLPYLPWLRRQIGSTKIIARDRSYLVTRSTRPTSRA